jgi:2-C-methyl-D-erythritol 2,4-cyclodiphosphate synthase
MRVGFGYDVHAFDAARPLILGGVTVEAPMGLAGWSDADVLIHAIVDAMLGAAGLGDLGVHFSSDDVPEGISSLELMAKASSMVGEAGYRIANVDGVVAIQDVLLSPYKAEMERRISEALGLDSDAVNVKATTTDRLGFVGTGEGAVGMAVVLLESGGGGER